MTISIVIKSVIVLACAAFLGWRGYERGITPVLRRMASIFSGYVASYFFIKTLAAFFEKTFALHGLLSYVFSSLILFFSAAFAVNFLILRFVKRMEEEEDEQIYRAGMITGAVLGCAFGLILVWVASRAMAVTQVSQPSVANMVERLKTNPRVIALIQQPEFQERMQNASPEQLLTDPTFKELAEIIFADPSIAGLGFSDKPATSAIDEHTSAESLKEQGFEAIGKPQWERVNPKSATESSTTEGKNVIYRWTDNQGQVHFSQEKPQSHYAVEVIRTL